MIKKVLLALIVTLAIGLRFYQLGELPSILNRDEAALAYNAFLLQKTGQDEWQRAWPLTLESFGDYKLPGYSWLLVVAFSVFDPAEWVVRLPAAVAGVWLVMMAYLIARCLKWSKRDQLLIVFLVAVTPVFIFYSRMAWEAMVSLSLAVTAFYLLWMLKASGGRRVAADLIGVVLVFGAIFTYNTPFIILPFLLPTLILARGWRRAQAWGLPVVGLVAVLAMAAFVFIPLTSQKSGITVFSDPTIFAQWVEYRRELPAWQQSTLGHRYLYQGAVVAQNALESFGPEFLSIRGGTHPWHQVPGKAHLFWTAMVLSWIGLGVSVGRVAQAVVRKKFGSIPTTDSWLLFLTAVTLIPSIITVDAPHATRSLGFFLVLLFSAVHGWQWLITRFKKQQTALIALVMALLIAEALCYSYTYFIRYPHDQNAYRPGLAMALDEITTKYPNQKVAVVDPDGYTYILVAWYRQLDPETYFSTTIRQQPDRIGFRYGQQVAEYHFVVQAADRLVDENVVLEWREDHWRISP